MMKKNNISPFISSPISGGFYLEQFTAAEKGVTTSIINAAWLDTSTVSSCGGTDLDDAPSACCLSPTVPDLSCSARMP